MTDLEIKQKIQQIELFNDAYFYESCITTSKQKNSLGDIGKVFDKDCTQTYDNKKEKYCLFNWNVPHEILTYLFIQMILHPDNKWLFKEDVINFLSEDKEQE